MCTLCYVCVRARSGRWLTLQASLSEPHTNGSSETVIVLEPPGPKEMLWLNTASYGLTARERAVVDLVMRGFTTAQISAPPSPPQPQQQPSGLWQQFKRPILWFLGSLVVAGLLGASMAPRILYFGSGFTVYAFDQIVIRLILFAPLWLILGGLFYLVARPLGKNLSLPQVVFDRQLTIVMVVLVLLSGLSYF